MPLLNNVQIGVASASNTINRTTQALVLDSKLDAGALYLLASSSASVTAGTESMAVTGGDAEGAADMSISLAGTFAWNQLLGGVKASLQGSTVNSTGVLRVQALNATKVDATSTAGTSMTESAGSAGGASLAFNAVGWDMGNIAAAALNSLIGTDVGFTVLPLETLAFISTSQVSAAGDVAVTAQDLIEISAFLSNSAEASSGAAASALSVAAGAVLASNRVRSSTRAYIDGRDSQGLRHYALSLGAGLEVLADDAASITADVSMSAVSSGAGGSSVSVGGIVVRNDVRNDVLGQLIGLTVNTVDDLSVNAVSSTAIVATLSGEVRASQEEGAASGPAPTGSTSKAGTNPGAPASTETVAAADPAASAANPVPPASETPPASAPVAGGGAMAANGLIAVNLILSQVQALALDSVLVVGKNLAVDASNDATIAATNTAITESSGTAVGATLAFNTLGWQSQNILFAAVDALLGTAIGTELPVSVRAEISGSSLNVGGDLSLSAVQVPQISATIENKVEATASGAAVSFVLASNMISARADTVLKPLVASNSYAIGGNLLVKASDTSGIEADVSMGSSSAGGAAVGGLVARNDVRNVVKTWIESAALEVGGDVTIEARGSATITATLSGETSSLPEEEAPSDEPATSGAAGSDAAGPSSLAVNALIATNLILSNVTATLLDSDINAGGNFDVIARNASQITADNAATMEAGGVAVGVTLAFNTIGWRAQNVLFAALDALLGTAIGNEQSAVTDVLVKGSTLSAVGSISLDAQGEAKIAATIANDVTSSTASAAASFILASNLVSSRTRVLGRLSDTASREVSFSAGENLSFLASDTAAIEADVSLSSTSAGGMAMGGMVVRNDVRGAVQSEARDATLKSGGNLALAALQSASISAKAAGNT